MKKLALLVVSLAMVSTSYATNMAMFVNVVDVPGESIDANHPGWILAEAVGFGEPAKVAGARPELTIIKDTDVATPRLMQLANSVQTTGRDVDIEFCQVGVSTICIFSLSLNEVKVESAILSADLSSLPKEKVVLSYGRATATYQVIDPSSGMPTGEVISHTWVVP